MLLCNTMRALHGSPCNPDTSSTHKAGKIGSAVCPTIFSISEQTRMLCDSLPTYEPRHFLRKEILMHKLMKYNPVSSPHRVRMRSGPHEPSLQGLLQDQSFPSYWLSPGASMRSCCVESPPIRTHHYLLAMEET